MHKPVQKCRLEECEMISIAKKWEGKEKHKATNAKQTEMSLLIGWQSNQFDMNNVWNQMRRTKQIERKMQQQMRPKMNSISFNYRFIYEIQYRHRYMDKALLGWTFHCRFETRTRAGEIKIKKKKNCSAVQRKMSI